MIPSDSSGSRFFLDPISYAIAVDATIVVVCLFLTLYVLIAAYHFIFYKKLQKCFLYYGRVSHCRLKGGAIHSFNYPICFSYLDIDEVKSIGWSFWPFFSLNGKWLSFSSFENKHHLTDWPLTTTPPPDISKVNSHSKPFNSVFDLPERVREFVRDKLSYIQTHHHHYHEEEIKSVSILTHLTYFGYCFNPVTFYYINYNNADKAIPTSGKEIIIAEVSNTPWIEQHSYALHESVPNVKIVRDHQAQSFDATWRKEFHVSPFMEMDYEYRFQFSKPTETIWVKSQMIKLNTKEVWFTANFQMERLPFTPANLMYILLFYPLHTRAIQVLIHWEAVKLWWKGIPTFEHPQNPDIDFGLGVTDKHLLRFIGYMLSIYNTMFGWMFVSKSTSKLLSKTQ